MGKNYLTYPCKQMRITQNYNGTYSHRPHVTGSPKDYPLDEGCSDSGRDYMYCPCDQIKVKRLYGIGSRGTNTIWLESTTKVDFADGTNDYFSMLVIHPNDSDIKKLKVGQTFKRGEKICLEGSDGATGNHFHFAAGKGKVKGSGWTQNSARKWVLTTTTKTDKPENLFFIDRSFTKVISTKGLNFKDLSAKTTTSTKTNSTSSSTKSNGNYKVTASVLNVRSGPSTSYDKKTFSQLTSSAQAQVLKLAGYKANGYVKGVAFTALEIKGDWARTPSGWVSLNYCDKI